MSDTVANAILLSQHLMIKVHIISILSKFMKSLPVHESADLDTVVEDVHLGARLVFQVGRLQHH